MIWYNLRFNRQIHRAALLSIYKSEIILHKQMYHDLLDLVGGEEASWTSMPAVTKRHILQVASRPLQTPDNGRIGRRGAEISKPKSIKDFWIGEYIGIHGNSLSRNSNGSTCRDYEAIVEAIIFFDDSVKGSFNVQLLD